PLGGEGCPAAGNRGMGGEVKSDDRRMRVVSVILRCERSEPRRMNGPHNARAVALRGPLRGHLRVTDHGSNKRVLAARLCARAMPRHSQKSVTTGLDPVVHTEFEQANARW